MATTAYRIASYGNPLRSEPSRLGGRFHSADETSPTQYLCLHPLGPHAELMRAADLREEEQVLAVRARTWALRLELDGLTEIGFDNAGDFGIRAESLVADDHAACRRLGGHLRGQLPGLIVPSAALPGTRNAVLFGPRVGSPYLLESLGTVDVPASVTAEGGRPLATLIQRVRFRGDHHSELEAWRRGTPYEFEEPDWSAR